MAPLPQSTARPSGAAVRLPKLRHMNSSHLPTQPVQQGRNAFQRWYFNWAEPHYLRMPAELQAQARSLDQFLYSRAGAWFWLGLLMAIGGAAGGLRANGVGWLAAWLISLVLVIALLFVLLGTWLRPETVARGSGWPKKLLLVFAGSSFGVLIGWVSARLAMKGFGAWADLPKEALKFAQVGVPAALLLCVVLALMMWITASARRYRMQQELQRLRDAEDRERMAREASEARLRLLQAQIQPHFIFNTLSAVQHWVDSGDARASGLLRALTGFLRGSAELMLLPRVSLAVELALVEQYLQVMQARWGERLRYRIDVDAACATAAELPPGIVLSLVENALEHGIAPSLSGGELLLQLQPCSADDGPGWRLRVQDSGVGLPPDWQEGLGLGNSRARLAQAFGVRASLSLRDLPEGGCEARVTVRPVGAGETDETIQPSREIAQ